MEETTVLIVGAGPSGLALAVNMGRMNIKTVILEKELEVTEDPRGIAITGDAVRISYQLGIGKELTTRIGDETGILYFHNKTFNNPAFMGFNTKYDHMQQSVSNAINQFQPHFERALRARLQSMPSIDLRVGCEVLGRKEEEDSLIINYSDKDGNKKSIRTSYLIGADGKRGIVRKKFLEPEGIRQEVGLYNHVSTWIAANFDIALPTPATHPDFPLWSLGYSPEQVYEAFWPTGFHFVNDTKRPAVSGRFGPKGARLWRHEFSVESGDNIDDPVGHLWSQFGPWLEIPGSQFSDLKGTTVSYPRDCIDVTRCRPFTFAARVINRWSCRRTILIGDAAHVFPPFGGQGIAAGIRDAQTLSWRLAFLSRLSLSPAVREKFLTGWGHEQRQACDHATKLTKTNGSITNQRSALLAFLTRTLMRILWCVPGVATMITRVAMGDTARYQKCDGLFALREKGGGFKIPQIWIRRGEENPRLSDEVFCHDMSRLSLIVIVEGKDDVDEISLAKSIGRMSLPGGLLTEESITFLRLGSGKSITNQQVYRPCGREELLAEGFDLINGYNVDTLKNRIGSAAKYVILRPDFYIHSVASTEEELLDNARTIAEYFR